MSQSQVLDPSRTGDSPAPGATPEAPGVGARLWGGIRTGCTVCTSRGPAGHLDRLVIDPRRRQIAALVVQTGWPLGTFGRAVVVPAMRVRGLAPSGDLLLDLDDDELHALPGYLETARVTSDPSLEWPEGYQREHVLARVTHGDALPDEAILESGLVPGRRRVGVPVSAITIRRDEPVTCLDGDAGHVEWVVCDPVSGQVVQLAVRCQGGGPFFGRLVRVPVQQVHGLDDEVFVEVTRAQLAAFPDFQPRAPDEALAEAVRRALWHAAATRAAARGVRVTCAEGIAHVTGTVASAAMRAMVVRIVGAVPGVRGVDAVLVIAGGDPAGTVAAALARDARTAGATIEVVDDGAGKVSLYGTVATPGVKAAAMEVAGRVPGVYLVVDELRLALEPAEARWPGNAAGA